MPTIAQETIDAFEQMWGPFPEPVMLIHKDRTVLAANQMARAAGIQIETKCFSYNPEGVKGCSKGCQAAMALREHRPVVSEGEKNGAQVRAYWMPLAEAPEVYVHFGIGVAAAMGIEQHPVLSAASLAPAKDLVQLSH